MPFYKKEASPPGNLYPSLNLRIMLLYPREQILALRFARCKLQEYIGELLLCVSQLYSVEREEHKRRVRGYSFVAVHKGMIPDEAVPEARGFLYERRIQIFGAERREGRGEGRFEKTFVSKPGLSARLGYKMFVQNQYLALA